MRKWFTCIGHFSHSHVRRGLEISKIRHVKFILIVANKERCQNHSKLSHNSKCHKKPKKYTYTLLRLVNYFSRAHKWKWSLIIARVCGINSAETCSILERVWIMIKKIIKTLDRLNHFALWSLYHYIVKILLLKYKWKISNLAWKITTQTIISLTLNSGLNAAVHIIFLSLKLKGIQPSVSSPSQSLNTFLFQRQ